MTEWMRNFSDRFSLLRPCAETSCKTESKQGDYRLIIVNWPPLTCRVIKIVFDQGGLLATPIFEISHFESLCLITWENNRKPIDIDNIQRSPFFSTTEALSCAFSRSRALSNLIVAWTRASRKAHKTHKRLRPYFSYWYRRKNRVNRGTEQGKQLRKAKTGEKYWSQVSGFDSQDSL